MAVDRHSGVSNSIYFVLIKQQAEIKSRGYREGFQNFYDSSVFFLLIKIRSKLTDAKLQN